VAGSVGYMAVTMADVAGPDGTVLALEPEPRNFSLLAENARHARWRNIVPFDRAVRERTGTTTLFLSPRDGGDHRTVMSGSTRAGIEVPLVSLDALADERRTRIHFVKMDIQGAEAAAIRGAKETLAHRDLRGLVLEFWPDALRAANEDPLEVLARIREGGLRCANEPAVDDDPNAFLVAVSRVASE